MDFYFECLNIFYNEEKTKKRFRVIFRGMKKEPDSMRKRRISNIHIEYLDIQQETEGE